MPESSCMGRPRRPTLALLALLALPLIAAERPLRDRFDTVVVDAGHGGEDHGARGERGLVEKELVLDVAQRLAVRLKANGLHVVMTRQQDVLVPLESRYAAANEARGDLFVSIHGNAIDDPEVRGTETFFLSLESSDADAQRLARRENAAFGGSSGARVTAEDPLLAVIGDMMVNDYHRESSAFAKLAQTELAAIDPANSRGVKQAPFVVLMGVQMPASLVEIGFITNAQDERQLRSSSNRDQIAAALARAILAFGRHYDLRRGVGSETDGRPARAGR